LIDIIINIALKSVKYHWFWFRKYHGKEVMNYIGEYLNLCEELEKSSALRIQTKLLIPIIRSKII